MSIGARRSNRHGRGFFCTRADPSRCATWGGLMFGRSKCNIGLAPIWCVHYFPSQDGPAHVSNAKILLDYHRADAPALRKYYVLNHWPEPNLAGHWIMAGLMNFLPPFIAEKVLLSLYIVLL